jgi:hypothetical protein
MKNLVLVSLVALLAIGSSALAYTEDFEGNPDITTAPWSVSFGPAVVGAPSAPNPSSLSMNHPDFTQENLDLTHASVNEATATGYVELDLFLGSGAQRIHLKNPTGWNVARIHIWGNGGGADADISINNGDFSTLPGLEAFDVVKYGEWSRIRVDWDMPNELISISVNGAALPTLTNVAGMEPGYGNYANETVTAIQSFAWTGTQGLNQVDNIGINEPAPAPMIPEPATLAMLGLGGLLLRRRKKA